MAVDFELAIDRFVTKTKLKMAGMPYAIGLDLLNFLKEHTPVVTGNLRASWHLKVDKDRLTISTGVVYARRVEYGFTGEDSLGRYFTQTGRGMVRMTMEAAPRLIKETVARLT